MDQLLAMIFLFSGNFAPQGYAFCAGQTLAINGNEAMFSLMGTQYGGDGRTTFQLPDLRGRVPIGQGQGPATSNYNIGQSGGAETVTITQNQMPSHSHALNVTSGPGNSLPGSTTYLAAGILSGSGPNANPLYMYTAGGSGNDALNPNTIAATGGGQPFTVIQPYLAITYIIATQGIYPARN